MAACCRRLAATAGDGCAVKHPGDVEMKSMLLATALIFVTDASVSAAAVVKEDVIGCRNEADLKPAAPAPRSKKSAPVSEASKTKNGACTSLTKGLTVSVDQKKGDLFCVRLYGGLDCYWTQSSAINQNPAAAGSDNAFGSRTFKPILNGTMPGMQTSF
jgi:hypothetical protein